MNRTASAQINGKWQESLAFDAFVGGMFPLSSHQCLETCDLIIAVGPVQGSQYLPSKSFENLHALAKSLGIPSQRWQAASENLGENGRAGRRLGVILLYTSHRNVADKCGVY